MNIESAARPAAPAGSPSGGFRAQLLGQAVRRHPALAAGILALAAGVAAAVWFLLPLPKLTGSTVFRISSTPPALLNPTAEARIDFPTYRIMQGSLVKQRQVLGDALKRPEAQDLPTINRQPDRVAYLERSLKVDFLLGPEFMRVSLEGDDEAELQRLLTALGAAYLAEVDRKENGAKTVRRAELENRRRHYESALQSYQGTLTKLATALQASSPAGLALMEDFARSRLENLKADLIRTEKEFDQATRDAKTSRERAALALLPQVSGAEIDRAVQADAGTMDREKTVLERRRTFEDLDRQVRDKTHPRLVEAQAALDAARADLDRYTTALRPKLAADLQRQLVASQTTLARTSTERAESLRASKLSLEKSLTDIQRELGEKSVIYLDLEKVRHDIARTEKWYEQIVLELDQYELEKGAPLRVTLAEAPYAVSGVEGNRRLKTALIGSFGVLLLGMAGLAALEMRNRRVLAIEDVGRSLGLTVFGTLPRTSADRSESRQAAITEAMDTARAMLLYRSYEGRSPKTILVTSALPGEGKTSLAGHLAISLTRAGYRTLLMDADLRNPTNQIVFDLPAGPGVCELLRGEAALAEAVQPSPFPGLSILPAGRWSLDATQALAGPRWTTIRAAVETAFDFVIIDSAPLLPVVDSLLLGRHVDGVILSVMHGHSLVASVSEAHQRLAAVGANVLGVVLAGVEPGTGRYGYGYEAPARQDYAVPVSA